MRYIPFLLGMNVTIRRKGNVQGFGKELAWMFRCLFMKSVFDGMGCPAVWGPRTWRTIFYGILFFSKALSTLFTLLSYLLENVF